MPEVDVEKLLETGAHFGHQSRRWNPRMAPYIFGVRDGVRVFDLIKTKVELEKALDVIKKASKEGKNILLIGTKKQASEKVREIGEKHNIHFVSERWLGGTFTNFSQVKKSIDSLEKMKEDMTAGAYKNYTKKERLLIQRKIDKMENQIGGISGLKGIPDLMIIIDTHREHGAVAEAQQLGVETIGIVDSNADPNEVDWPIPMNDDAQKALDYVLGLIEEAIIEGKGKTTKKTTKKVVKKKKDGKSKKSNS